jgi:hypothetical protein
MPVLLKLMGFVIAVLAFITFLLYIFGVYDIK